MMSLQRRSRLRNPVIVLLTALVFGFIPGADLFLRAPGSFPFAQEASAATLDPVRETLGKILVSGISRVLEAANNIGRNFEGRISAQRFVDDGHRLHLQIDGFLVLEGRWARHRVVRFFTVETPLPKRPECQGFFQVALPEWAAKVADHDPLKVPFRLDLQVDLDGAMKVAGMGALNKFIEATAVFSRIDYQRLFAGVSDRYLQDILSRFFPGFLKFLTTRSIGTAFDEALANGEVTGAKILSSFGMDDFVGFGVNFGLGLASKAAGGAAAGAAAGAVGGAVLAVPVIGEVAVGTFLVIVSAKTAATLVAWSKRAFQDTIFLDRFSKIDWYFQGRYPPGDRDCASLIDQITREGSAENYETLSKYLLFLRFRSPEVRQRWASLMTGKILPVLEVRGTRHRSWAAPKYKGMIEVLFAKP